MNTDTPTTRSNWEKTVDILIAGTLWYTLVAGIVSIVMFAQGKTTNAPAGVALFVIGSFVLNGIGSAIFMHGQYKTLPTLNTEVQKAFKRAFVLTSSVYWDVFGLIVALTATPSPVNWLVLGLMCFADLALDLFAHYKRS